MRKYVICFLAMILMLNTSVITFAEEKDKDCQIIQEDMTIEYDDDFLSIQTLILEPMSWTIKNKLEKRTRSFQMKKGKDITIKINISNIENVKVGIIDEQGTKKNISVKKKIDTSILAPKTGTYKVFVSNKSDRAVKVSGFYSY